VLLADRVEQVQDRLRQFGRAVIAFSGGVDSTLLVKLARDVLGRNHVLAVAADSPSLARPDIVLIQQLAERLDVRLRLIQTDEVDNPLYRHNTPDRCYICKETLFARLREIAREEGNAKILYGAIGDDAQEDRPGAKAAAAAGVHAPLQEVGMTKEEVRELARALGLPNWNRPQNACLSSRVPHGREVTPATLRQIEEAEAILTSLGFQHVRVRHLGDHARIEVGPGEVGRFEDQALCQRVVARFHELGFVSIGLNRAGYQRGGADHARIEEQVLSGQEQGSRFEAV